MNIPNFSLLFKLSFILSGASASSSSFFSRFNTLSPRTTAPDTASGTASNSPNVQPPPPFKLERITSCEAAKSKETFLSAIQTYINEANTQSSTNTPTSDTTDSQAKALILTDLNLSPYELSLKKLNVLFNCPKSNDWLSAIKREELTTGPEIPKIIVTALQSKLAEFPYGSLQSDVDESLQTCVDEIKKVDHETLCQQKNCTQGDMDNLKKNLITLKSCHHNFMADTLTKLTDAVRADPNVTVRLGSSYLPRTEVAELLKKFVDTLPVIKNGGMFSSEKPAENTSKNCRTNLKRLLGIVDSDDQAITQQQSPQSPQLQQQLM